MTEQLPLDPQDLLPVREAFSRTELPRKYTFEQAMAVPNIARCLLNQAEAIVKKDRK